MKNREDLIKIGLEESKADDVMLLESKMLETAVRFQFRKKDGSLREAVGTLKREKMVQEDGKVWEPVGESRPEVTTLVKYWDCEKCAWRSFNVLNLVSVFV